MNSAVSGESLGKPGPAMSSKEADAEKANGVVKSAVLPISKEAEDGAAALLNSELSACPRETEEEKLMAPESAAEEEERLREHRKKQTEQALQDVFRSEDAVLDGSRFAQLDELLSKTDLYTKFLSEQMSAIEARTDAEAGEAQAVGGKRKAGKGAGGARKRGPGASALSTHELLPLIEGELRQYQLKGVKWLISLYQNGLNGILADQMGLGKTVQTIGFLSHLRSKGVHGPFMVVGPLSTLPNWVSEFARWCPSMPCILYHGTKAERQALRSKRMPSGKMNEHFPVVVTSYEIVIADVKFLQRYNWKYIVVDEGHRLKNFNCKLLRELRTIPTANKLLLTGTPLQNNLSELWSLLNFLLPDVFNSLANFESWFDFSGVGQAGGDQHILAQEQRNRVVSKLHAILRPFLLRRIKSDVETSLPAKMEIVLYAGMSDVQRQFNDQLRDRTLHEVMAKERAGMGGAPVAKLNNVLMQMRKNCNHPDLISGAYDGSLTYPSADELVEQCGKLALLDRILTRLHRDGHKVLIFSQMTRMLDLLDTYLEQRGHRAARIDGSISWQDRQESMRAFNTDPDMFAFLLSTRAGGLGINLTSADTVIIYDSDWNPQSDLQAMDRCHRIGQQKPVLVFRLATAQSVEGKLLRRANSKLALERLVIKKGAFLPGQEVEEAKATSMSAEELMDLLKADAGGNDVPQSGVIDDQVLEQLLNRKHLERSKPTPYPEFGVGYEVVQQLEGSGGLLSGIQ
ncbi:hypothetical protein WJX81_005727 [Elliptochloris bilobata]|uniref:Uncharacterized protein n=1 Tax=Elliptochloris bilobata TaxID=381761 RepID=A0AAW1S1L0_9CHLO